MVAEKLGVVAATISRIENGHNDPTDETKTAIEALLGGLPVQFQSDDSVLRSTAAKLHWLASFIDDSTRTPESRLDQLVASAKALFYSLDEITLAVKPPQIVETKVELHDRNPKS